MSFDYVVKVEVIPGPFNGPHYVNERVRWCIDNFGPQFGKWKSVQIRMKVSYFFVEENDAILFTLRWGHTSAEDVAT